MELICYDLACKTSALGISKVYTIGLPRYTRDVRNGIRSVHFAYNPLEENGECRRNGCDGAAALIFSLAPNTASFLPPKTIHDQRTIHRDNQLPPRPPRRYRATIFSAAVANKTADY